MRVQVPAPAGLEPVESRVLVKPSPPELAAPLGADAFGVLLPASLRDKVRAWHARACTPCMCTRVHPLTCTAALPSSPRPQLVAQHAATHALLQELGERSSRDAERAASRLRELRLPAVLDEATAADGRLPPATRAKVEAAKAVGDVAALDQLRGECEAQERETSDLLGLAQV